MLERLRSLLSKIVSFFQAQKESPALPEMEKRSPEGSTNSEDTSVDPQKTTQSSSSIGGSEVRKSYTWIKGQNLKLSPHFGTWEFDCRCVRVECLLQAIDVELIEILEDLRERIGMPIVVTSGYRCSPYQTELREGGLPTAQGLSTHELGRACDITCKDLPTLKAVVPDFFKAIGDAPRFVHVDLRREKVRRWNY